MWTLDTLNRKSLKMQMPILPMAKTTTLIYIIYTIVSPEGSQIHLNTQNTQFTQLHTSVQFAKIWRRVKNSAKINIRTFMINTQIHSIFENHSKSAKGNYTNLNIQEVFRVASIFILFFSILFLKRKS